MSLKTKDQTRFDGYLLDRSRWTLQWREEPIALNRKSFDLLLYLVDHRDRVIGKDELLQALWPDQFVEESNLSQQVFLLRKALSRHDSGKKFIETVPGRGYRFTAHVEIDPIADAQPEFQQQIVVNSTQSVTQITIEEEEIDSDPGELPAMPASARRAWRPALVFSGALVATVILAAGWFGWQRWLDRTGGPPVEVVLTPMEGSTGDTVLDHALVDALRMDLSQSPFVSVVSAARVRATLTEMLHKQDDPMTTAVAREVCERTNSQAVLHGTVARLGQHFLLTELATSCVSGSELAEAKQEASNAEDLPHCIDELAEKLRQKLGESRRSIARFDTPLFAVNTASLEALKDFSQAGVQSNLGRYTDAISLLKKAVAADPGFASGYFDLAANYGSTQNFAAEREAILKAYSLRDSASEPIRLAIIGLYHSVATEDLYEAERNYRNWTQLYPRSAQAWNGLSVVQRSLGHHQDSVVSAARALELRPAIQGLYSNLSFEQLHTGDLKGALATCEHAVARGLDGDYVRQHYLEAAYALHDAALIQKQRDWAEAHPEAVYIRIEEAEIAITEGRFSDALRLLPQIEALMRRQGLANSADTLIRAEASNLAEAGDVAGGARLFRTVPVDPKDETSVIALARIGDFAASETALRAMQAEFPQGTIWNDYRAPEVEALAAMSAHKPRDAIAALERARPLDGLDLALPLIRAEAYLTAGEPDIAEKEYRQIAQGPAQNVDSEEFPLAWLGLGRTLAAQGNRPAAIDAYQHFLNLWAHADPDALYLRQGRQELATLKSQPAR